MIHRLAFAAVAAFMSIAPSTVTADEVSWLFLQSAARASFDGTYLRLENIGARTTAFSDRPYRAVRDISTEGFVALWTAGTDSFEADPPNAGISGVDGHDFLHAVIELSHPRLEGEALIYEVEVLHGAIPAAMTEVTLLVDAWSSSVNSQITDSVTQVNVEATGGAAAQASDSAQQALSELAAASSATTEAQQDLTTESATTEGIDAIVDQPQPETIGEIVAQTGN